MENLEKQTEIASFDQIIEQDRLAVYKKFNIVKRISSVITVVCMLILVGAMILTSFDDSRLVALGWILMILCLIGMIFFYVFGKKSVEKDMKSYVIKVNNILNEEMFKDEKFKNKEFTSNKLEVQDVEMNCAYFDVNSVASRSYVLGEYDSLRFKFAEAALMKKVQKKENPTMFVGKIFDFVNPNEMKGRILIEIAAEQIIDAPNGMEHLTKLNVEDNISFFGDDNIEYEKVLGKEFLSILKKFKLNEHLLNVAISLTSGHTFVFLSYDNAVISTPFDTPFDLKAFESYKQTVNEVLNLIKKLGK